MNKMPKKYRIRITEEEHLHLLYVAGFEKAVMTEFGAGGVFLTEESGTWTVEEIAKLRGVHPSNNVLQPNG